MNKATVFYRLPNSNQIVKRSGLINSELSPISFENKDEKDVFYFAPFNSGNKAFHCILDKEINQFEVISYRKNNQIHYDTEENFIRKTADAIAFMKSDSSLNKVVFARCFKKELSYEIDINVFFLNLCLNYPSAFVYVISSSITGTWIAATPELLLKSHDNSIETTALAGTLTLNEDKKWSEKELDEQNKVEIFIDDLIKKNNMELKEKLGPETLIAGNLKHIVTKYTIESATNKTALFLAALNPTPAIAGLPKELAIKYIEENENLLRSFYTGFVGIKEKNTTSLFVNLRCMELFKNHINAYAGCGITKQSEPINEWNETENKLQTLLKFLA